MWSMEPLLQLAVPVRKPSQRLKPLRGEPPRVICDFVEAKTQRSFMLSCSAADRLVYATLCTNMSWLLFRAVKTMISF